MADPEVLRRRLSDAGLHDVQITSTAERPAFTSGREMWDWTYWGNPVCEELLTGVNEDDRARMRQSLDRMLRERVDASGRAVLSNAVHIAVGTK